MQNNGFRQETNVKIHMSVSKLDGGIRVTKIENAPQVHGSNLARGFEGGHGYESYKILAGWSMYPDKDSAFLFLTQIGIIISPTRTPDSVDVGFIPWENIDYARLEKWTEHPDEQFHDDRIMVIYSRKNERSKFTKKNFPIYERCEIAGFFKSITHVEYVENTKELEELVIIINDIVTKFKELALEYPQKSSSSLNGTKREPVSNKLKHEIWRRDNFTCQYCGKTINDIELEVDHILPVSKGGKSILSNLQTLCVECNRKKGAV